MEFKTPIIRVLGDAGIRLHWQVLPSEALLLHMLSICNHLRTHLECEVIHTYTEILIKTQPTQALLTQLEALLATVAPYEISQRKLHTIPVCYGGEQGADLEALARLKNRSAQDIIELHSTPAYLIYCMGFLPGFLYLEGLPSALETPRKEKPSMHVPRGSVAIGGAQTGIYPQESPGGWHLIGQTPLRMFDPLLKRPSPFKAGDKIKFEPVTVDVFEDIRKQIARGGYAITATGI